MTKKLTPTQQNVIDHMTNGATLEWDWRWSKYRLVINGLTRDVSTATVNALRKAGALVDNGDNTFSLEETPIVEAAPADQPAADAPADAPTSTPTKQRQPKLTETQRETLQTLASRKRDLFVSLIASGVSTRVMNRLVAYGYAEYGFTGKTTGRITEAGRAAIGKPADAPAADSTPRQLRAGKFTVDGEHVYDGYTYGDTWNGVEVDEPGQFAVPLFNDTEAPTVLQTEVSELWDYDADRNVFKIYNEHGALETEAEAVQTPIGDLYTIGGYVWCWREVVSSWREVTATADSTPPTAPADDVAALKARIAELEAALTTIATEALRGDSIAVGGVVSEMFVSFYEQANEALDRKLEVATPPMVSYAVSINGQWYSDDMPEADFDEETAVERTVKRVLGGGTYEAHIVYASYPDGEFVSYDDGDEG